MAGISGVADAVVTTGVVVVVVVVAVEGPDLPVAVRSPQLLSIQERCSRMIIT